MKLNDRVAVITGAASGIGRACAIEFAKEGARVVLADVNLPGAMETVRVIESAGGVAHAVETDVADPPRDLQERSRSDQSDPRLHPDLQRQSAPFSMGRQRKPHHPKSQQI
jgi:NAD(P)-dependent dehydrogenase (short-subunit alcohol dehydrogenase family)